MEQLTLMRNRQIVRNIYAVHATNYTDMGNIYRSMKYIKIIFITNKFVRKIENTYLLPLNANRYFLLVGKLLLDTKPLLPARSGCCLWNNGMLISKPGRI